MIDRANIVHFDKLEPFIIPGKTILLGIFNEANFRNLEDRGGILAFGNFFDMFSGSMMTIITGACFWAEKIIFVLDGLWTPIDCDRSITCRELIVVCENINHFNKTIFILGNKIVQIDRDNVLNGNHINIIL